MSEPTRLKAVAAGAFLGGPLSLGGAAVGIGLLKLLMVSDVLIPENVDYTLFVPIFAITVLVGYSLGILTAKSFSSSGRHNGVSFTLGALISPGIAASGLNAANLI